MNRRKLRELRGEYEELADQIRYYKHRTEEIVDEIEDLVVEKDNIEVAWEDAEERRDEV